MNYRGGGYLNQREFVAACYILLCKDDRLKLMLIFNAFSAGSDHMTKDELKALLVELVVGTQTAEWRAYPRQNITMDDFDSLVTLMAEAALVQVASHPDEPFVPSQTSTASATSSNSGSGSTPAIEGMDLEQFIRFAVTEHHIQYLVKALHAAGARIHQSTMAVPEDQSDYYR